MHLTGILNLSIKSNGIKKNRGAHMSHMSLARDAGLSSSFVSQLFAAAAGRSAPAPACTPPARAAATAPRTTACQPRYPFSAHTRPCRRVPARRHLPRRSTHAQPAPPPPVRSRRRAPPRHHHAHRATAATPHAAHAAAPCTQGV